MHEWALAEAVLDTVKKKTEDTTPGGVRVTIRFGELQSIDTEVFQEGLRQLAAGDDGPNMDFVFLEEPARFSCSVCGHAWAFSECELDEATREAIHFLPEVAHTFVSCPDCGSADFRVTSGRGVAIESVENLGEAEHD